MDSVIKNAIHYKEDILTGDKTTKESAVRRIKNCLETIKDDSFIKVILNLELHTILLEHLIKSHYAVNPDILKCIEHLCSYKIYFTNDHAVSTAEITLKNVFNLVKSDMFENVLLDSLKIITKIIENLNDYHTRHNLTYHCYLSTIRNIFTYKKDSEIICITTKMLSALLDNKKFQNHINDNILKELEDLWTLGFQNLAEIFDDDAKSSVVAASKLCDTILRFFTEIRVFKQDTIEEIYDRVKNFTINVLKCVCIPFISEFGLQSDICVEYLCFLKTFLTSNFRKEILAPISKKLVFDLNFTVITKYLEKSVTMPDIEERASVRKLCLRILCEIIVNLNDVSSFSFSVDRCKKHLYKCLLTIESCNVHDWLILLKNSKIDIETKLGIIKFCTMYYVYSNNGLELLPEHLDSYIEFLQRFPNTVNINIYYLKDIWLLFAAVYYENFPMFQNDSTLYKATSTLERLISVHEKSFEKIFIFHPYIIFWLFLNPFIKKELMNLVTNRWLLLSAKDPVVLSVLVYTVGRYSKATELLLTIIQQGSAAHAAAAASVLRAALLTGPLANCQDFSRQLAVAVPACFKKLNEEEGNEDKVKRCIYMLHLSSFISTPPDRNLLEYSVQSITSCMGSLGISKRLPVEFYTNAFEYVNKILLVAKNERIKEVFISFMNSERMLYTMKGALVLNNQKVSSKASQIFNNLLDYQSYCRLYCKNTIIIKKELVEKLFCVEDTEQLELNLQILKTLLFKTAKSVLDLEIDDYVLKGLYFRCLNLVSKPCEHSLSSISLNCMEGILKYTQTHNNLKVQNYLCHLFENHMMIRIYFDEETSRKIERSFLSFILCWLQFATNKEDIMNKLSINYTFWKISVNQITDLILNDNVDLESDNADLTNGILRQLFKLSELLPVPVANYLRSIEDNLN